MYVPHKNDWKLLKRDALLRREISLKVICVKDNFLTVIFAIIYMTMNIHAYKLFKQMLNDVQINGQGEIHTA